MYAMLSSLGEKMDQWLGLHLLSDQLGLGHMVARSLIVFTLGVVLVRMGDRRLLGKNAGFDMLLIVILGSVLSRGINGQAAFLPTLGVSVFLVLLHHLTAVLACRSPWFSRWLKGAPLVVVADGRVRHDALRRARMTRDDLDENLRVNGGVSDAAKVQEARLERNGTISVVTKA